MDKQVIFLKDALYILVRANRHRNDEGTARPSS